MSGVKYKNTPLLMSGVKYVNSIMQFPLKNRVQKKTANLWCVVR